MPVIQSLKSNFKEHAPRPVVDRARYAYHLLKRKVFNQDQYLELPNARQLQYDKFLSKILTSDTALICAIGTDISNQLPINANTIKADFDIASLENIVGRVNEERIDAFFVSPSNPRDLVNLTNLMGTYGLDSPVLIGNKLDCHSLIGYVPIMPRSKITSSISVHNYFSRNYKITDTMLYQGYAYQGNNLIDCHQFLLRPDETLIIDLEDVLDLGNTEPGTYYLEVIHPGLPTTTSELRYFGIYRDKTSGFMAGSHAIPLGSWSNQLQQRNTGTRTYIPNMEGFTVSYTTPGSPVQQYGKSINAVTTSGNNIKFEPSSSMGSLDSITSSPTGQTNPVEMEFDRIWPGLPIFGSNGFQTLSSEENGLAIWHDGNSVRDATSSAKSKGIPKAQSISHTGPQGSPTLAEEIQEVATVSSELIDLYQNRVRFFVATFPYLGQEYPDLHVVFDREQWRDDLTNFDAHLYSNSGSLVVSRDISFNGSLQTVNMNTLFSDYIAELNQGYWLITADPRKQGHSLDLSTLRYPSGSMLFGFWGDGTKLYDSVHSLNTRNSVGYDLGLRGVSDAAQRSGRIVSRTKKFAPLQSDGDRSSLFWVCNMGVSEELIDADVKIRLFGTNNQEGISSFTLPSGHARILSAKTVLEECGVSCTDGTLWIEANECNLGGIWFLQTGKGKGFAADHFTGA